MGIGLQLYLCTACTDRLAHPLDGWAGYGNEFAVGLDEFAALAENPGLVDMDVLLLLIPLSVCLALLIVIGLWWAVNSDQFENLDEQGHKILDQD
jgi:cbb3-type cytochrome oxidase maturation protein